MKNIAVSLVFKIIGGTLLAAVVAFLLYAKMPNDKVAESEVQTAPISVESDPAEVTAPAAPMAKDEKSNATAADAKAGAAPMALSEFQDLAKKTQANLPTVASLKGLKPAEVHHMPEALQQAASELGSIAQALHDNPNLAAEAAVFYEECFVRDELPVQIRALCLADHRNLRISHGDRPDWTPQEMNVPGEVRKLATLIPTK